MRFLYSKLKITTSLLVLGYSTYKISYDTILILLQRRNPSTIFFISHYSHRMSRRKLMNTPNGGGSRTLTHYAFSSPPPLQSLWNMKCLREFSPFFSKEFCSSDFTKNTTKTGNTFYNSQWSQQHDCSSERTGQYWRFFSYLEISESQCWKNNKARPTTCFRGIGKSSKTKVNRKKPTARRWGQRQNWYNFVSFAQIDLKFYENILKMLYYKKIKKNQVFGELFPQRKNSVRFAALNYH